MELPDGFPEPPEDAPDEIKALHEVLKRLAESGMIGFQKIGDGEGDFAAIMTEIKNNQEEPDPYWPRKHVRAPQKPEEFPVIYELKPGDFFFCPGSDGGDKSWLGWLIEKEDAVHPHKADAFDAGYIPVMAMTPDKLEPEETFLLPSSLIPVTPEEFADLKIHFEFHFNTDEIPAVLKKGYDKMQQQTRDTGDGRWGVRKQCPNCKAFWPMMVLLTEKHFRIAKAVEQDDAIVAFDPQDIGPEDLTKESTTAYTQITGKGLGVELEAILVCEDCGWSEELDPEKVYMDRPNPIFG